MNDVSERKARHFGWLLISFVSVLGILAGIGDTVGGAGPFVSLEFNSITGSDWAALVAHQPALASFIDILTRIVGLFLLSTSILALGISLNGYRSGERWTWFFLWALPLILALAEVVEFTSGGNLLLKGLYGVSLALSLLGLLWPYKVFFPGSHE